MRKINQFIFVEIVEIKAVPDPCLADGVLIIF